MVPDEFICPLTLEVFEDPIMTRTGLSFERKAILEWVVGEGRTTCPITRTPLVPSMMVSNVALRLRIRQWRHELMQRQRDLETKQEVATHMLSCY